MSGTFFQAFGVSPNGSAAGTYLSYFTKTGGTSRPPNHWNIKPLERSAMGSPTAKAGNMQRHKPLTYQAMLTRIKEIDAKFRSTDTWLHPTLSKLARERELLVEQANRDYKVGLKHEWR
jgi:hypothetical protein